MTTGVCTIKGEKTVIAVCDARFLMGSMGYVVGEKITRAVEKATEMNLPVINFLLFRLVSAMQEEWFPDADAKRPQH